MFLSSVLNSVPFAEDRAHIATIVAALCHPAGQLFAAARDVNDPTWKAAEIGGFLSETDRGCIQFPLTQEEGLILGDLSTLPKAQKFHTADEFRALFEPLFASVEIGRHINNVTAICRDPLTVDRSRLRAALEFEFDLPYPGGKRMGMVSAAIDAFSVRLGVAL